MLERLAGLGKGKGTYVTGGLLVLAGVLVALGKVGPDAVALSPEQVQGILAALGGMAAVFLRRAIGDAPKV